ncbi:MAG: hypothetical protein HOD43_01570 [Candidatus Marinimicrobia bacterium]|jgi:O-antigen/teichoic acid export membrane protein|nr:hypothetical protein [Candidatus Neomarinimicrobiota bacterium]MBT3630017.1 hypothetical protein [Candidatus Neomarinimicrobiota bacterium]MBT3825138.1 hypothetical protein [Candidatus Neomarinimicrobiota bacterium]MBT4129300.1 hypothetical protein [Candidatus Neomarinimicrobiota bacterium]MBT4294478.1 hypothetical protein [Candidatus Neomarinimicrobiota bacterium]
MSKNSCSLFLVPILALCVIGGFAFYLLEYEPMLSFKMIAIIVIALLVLAVPVYRSIQNARDKQKNIPLEDEMSRLLEIHAGAYAFRYSMMSWFAIFAFRSKFPDSEEMLGIGIMAAAAIYGLTWLYFKRNGIPHADQN